MRGLLTGAGSGIQGPLGRNQWCNIANLYLQNFLWFCQLVRYLCSSNMIFLNMQILAPYVIHLPRKLGWLLDAGML
jgi:hypothetical protein